MPFPGLSGSLFYHSLLMPYFTVFTLGYGTRVSGKHNLPLTGPALILSNHQSYLDPMLLGIAAYPRKLTFLARKELFRHRFFGPFIRWCGAVPIDQGFGRDGMRAIAERLDRGEAVVVFPEGGRTTTGECQQLKPGISLLLRNGTWPIIPTGLEGAFAAWPIGQTLPRFGPLFFPPDAKSLGVHFGEPIPASDYSQWNREQLLQRLQGQIAECHHRALDIRRT